MVVANGRYFTIVISAAARLQAPGLFANSGRGTGSYQQALRHHEARGGIYTAGLTRYNIAVILAGGGRTGDALAYARAALDNFEQAGPGAATDAADTEGLIAGLAAAR